MRVSVVGTGQGGLVNGLCLAALGHEVVCVDTDADRIARLAAGELPVDEPGLEALLRQWLGIRFAVTTDLAAAVAETEVTLVAVGASVSEDRIDLARLRVAAGDVGAQLAAKATGGEGYHLVVVKSTVVPGTTESLVVPILERASGRRCGQDFGVGMVPDFHREGRAVADCLAPDRIVLGGVDGRSLDRLSELYAPFDGVPLVRTTPSTAEMIKYTATALLATLVSFSNEIANLSAAAGVDVVDVMEGVHLDHRLSPILEDGSRVRPEALDYLRPGCGFGGSWFPQDVQALAAHAKYSGVEAPILNGTLRINRDQPSRFIEPVLWALERGARVAVLGASFKPGTGDVSASPTLSIVPMLVTSGLDVVLHDPVALEAARAVLGDDGIRYEADLDEALTGVDAVVVVTAWDDYADLPERLATIDPQPLLADGRRSYRPDSVDRYLGVGHPGEG